MSCRPSIRDLEQKLKAALLELEASKEMCDCLISECDDHKTEIRSVIFMNTKLKGELTELDVKCNDLTDQRDRLQVLASEMDDCRNQYEQSLMQIQVFQEEIEPRNFNYNLDNKLNNGMSDDGLDCTTSNKKTKHCIAHNKENVSMPENVTSALNAVINNENETVIYSDELGIGSSPMLSGYMNHRVASSFSRERSIRGGSLILIRNNLKFKERTDIVGLSIERVIEIVCVELERLVVMSVYRRPHSSYELLEFVMD
ncbi:hypothetical protein EVAR_64112_1 [Eumeta japonica]|uniref:Uncharacterized protein n=1 Tax=Eumeta variegata TaxID=151549 RepID=A0A4C1ZB65_EUMVA|nr:hypothetical protein EVAR_64112_1 [Eumeta japonica]